MGPKEGQSPLFQPHIGRGGRSRPPGGCPLPLLPFLSPLPPSISLWFSLPQLLCHASSSLIQGHTKLYCRQPAHDPVPAWQTLDGCDQEIWSLQFFPELEKITTRDALILQKYLNNFRVTSTICYKKQWYNQEIRRSYDQTSAWICN